VNRVIRLSATVAIISTAVLISVLIYLQVGAATGQKLSSFEGGGPFWPFTVFNIALAVGVCAFALFVVLQFKRGRQDR
jgi:hypothetical protein